MNTPVILLFSKKWVLGLAEEDNNNVIQWLGSVSSCWETYLLKCTEHHNRRADKYIHTEMMCGVLNTGMQITQLLDKVHQYDKTFHVYCNFGAYLKFLEFKLPSSVRCFFANVKVLSHSEETIYCGMRVPWTVALTESTFQIKISQLHLLRDEFSVILVYETIETSSPEAAIINEIFVMFIQGDHRTVPIEHSLFGNDHKNLLPGRLLHFLSHILDVVCLDVVPDYDAILYDGPGKFSSKTEFTDEEQLSGGYIRYCFSKFAGSAHISKNTHQSIIWFTEVNVKTSYLCKNILIPMMYII